MTWKKKFNRDPKKYNLNWQIKEIEIHQQRKKEKKNINYINKGNDVKRYLALCYGYVSRLKHCFIFSLRAEVNIFSLHSIHRNRTTTNRRKRKNTEKTGLIKQYFGVWTRQLQLIVDSINFFFFFQYCCWVRQKRHFFLFNQLT